MAKNDSILVDGIVAQRVADGIPSGDKGEAFEYFSFEQVLKNYDLSAEELESGWVDGRNDGGIDGIFIFVNGHFVTDVAGFSWPRTHAQLDIFIISCKHHDTFKEATLNSINSTVQEFFDLSRQEADFKGTYSKDILKARRQLVDAYKKLAISSPEINLRFFYCSRGDASNVGESVRARSEQVKESLVSVPLVFVVNGGSAYRTLADLLNAARGKPGDLTLASFGPASVFQIGFESLKRAAKIEMTFVPYPGVAPAVNALLGEHVTSVLASYSTVAEQLNAGKLRALATGSRTRIESLPEVPTVAESGYNDYEVNEWFGVVAPAKTPKETVAQLAAWFTAALRAPEIKQKLVAQGLVPVGLCGMDFGALIRKQYDEFGRVIREANIKAE